MLLTILGLGITTVMSLIGVIIGNHNNRIRLVLTCLTIAGFGLAIYSSYHENQAKKSAGANARIQAVKLTKANEQLGELRGTLALVKLTVGDLSKLNELSGGAKYYVRIAAAAHPSDLEAPLHRIDAEFKGAKKSGMVCIREVRPGHYVLVFGQGLDVAAAEVYQRLAMSHGLTPMSRGPNSHHENAFIEPESSAKCPAGAG